ncbi:hypothetical protein [Vreelandella olivaria]|uniref:hypothetical protein n=1 Tax=Vreelandella olivaria TaxID=390919 RepID=UPI00201FA0E0|nr:hypothetical protein [Halomonas olivaria]
MQTLSHYFNGQLNGQLAASQKSTLCTGLQPRYRPAESIGIMTMKTLTTGLMHNRLIDAIEASDQAKQWREV